MRLFAHFDENPVKEQSQPCNDITIYTFNDPFERLIPKTSSWTPPEGQHPSLDVFISKCRIDINNILNNHITSMHSNTSSEDRNAIKRLQERNDIVIKPADKGGAIVVWRRDLYFQEALRQISNTDFYYPIENDPTPHHQDIITATVAELISQKSLPNGATILIQDNPKSSMFYLLPIIHKVDNPGRPIVSTINCPTELISQYLDGIFFPLVTKLPTFNKDTSDVIRLYKDFKFTDDNQYRYLFTMDICSLYTNIPTEEGFAALKYYLECYTDKNRPSTPTLLKLTELVLNLSSFEFDGKYYIQKKGVAMGTKMGPNMHVCLLATLRRRCFSRSLVPNLLC